MTACVVPGIPKEARAAAHDRLVGMSKAFAANDRPGNAVGNVWLQALATALPRRQGWVSPDAAQRIIGFLLMREREAAAVRLIMAGKTAGFAAERVQERLRDLYG